MKRVLPAAALLALAASSPEQFRFSRSIEAPPGWCEVLLPDDVLDACRPGMPDLRVRENGTDVPFAFDRDIGGGMRRYELSNVESLSGRETTAFLDRGPSPPAARAAELVFGDAEVLKPVVLEASDDGKVFREIARGSVFAASGVRSAVLRFSANDRRFWRFRFDDRNGPAIRPIAVRIEGARPTEVAREVALTILSNETGPPQIVTARLSVANLGAFMLRVRDEDPAYDRRVQLFERVFFRDEVSRRLVGAGTIRRAPDGAPESEIPIGDLTGREIELEIEGEPDSNPLAIQRLTGLARRPRLIFHAGGPGETRSLVYGSQAVPPPRYDLAQAMREGGPHRLQPASLGPAATLGELPAATPAARGVPVDPGGWSSRRPIEPPASGGVTYLDLPAPEAADLASLRIVDHENRPVPHLVEQAVRRRSLPVAFSVRQHGSRTVVEIPVPAGSRAPDGVVLTATGPAYFSREVSATEEERDARGITGARVLGSARWERRPGESPRPLPIAIAALTTPVLQIEIENGENPPIAVSSAALQVPYTRVDFVCAPGERLWLLTGNPNAPAPRYDLAMIADRVLSSSAAPSRLGPPAAPTASTSKIPGWFWSAVVGAALLVVLALARTLRGESESQASGR